MDWCEANGVDYVFGLPGNRVLDRLVAEAADDVRTRRALEKKPCLRGFAETRYRAKSWKTERRACARIEATAQGLDIRFVVTSLEAGSAEHVYEVLYCARGQAENLIKLHKSQLASDRTSCRSPLANQVRLFLHTAAYWLILGLRDAIPKTHALAVAEWLAGPLHRFSDFKTIETTMFGGALQQVRYPPTRLAHSPGLAFVRLLWLPGSKYSDPEFSWKFESGPAGTAFVRGSALGRENDGTLWIGSSRSFQQVGGTGGSLYRFKLTTNRKRVDVSDPRIADRVADNLAKFEGTESESLIVGKGFGTTTDIEQGPDGSLYIVSITDSAIYKISRKP
jgi:hypothetical protein